MPVITAREDTVAYRQTTHVAPLGEPHCQDLLDGSTTERSEWWNSRSRTKGPERLEHDLLSPSLARPTSRIEVRQADNGTSL